jgi:uncharacterized membrane protein YeaQ/YmgE (transglycosylase-associated protein family)
MPMSALPWWGLGTWIAAGLAAGALARVLLPARHRCGWLAALAVAALGALAGGLAATALGFGGAGAASLPAAVVAALAAALGVLVLALLRSFRPPAAS